MAVNFSATTKWLAIGCLLCIVSQVFAADWMMTDGWWCTWVAMGFFVLVSAFLPPNLAGIAGFVYGFMCIGTAFWWAQRMLAYTMNQEGAIPKSVFVGLVIWEAFVFAIVGYTISRIRTKNLSSIGLLVPISIWIVAETYWPRVFCWTLGHSQQGFLPWVQIADIGGASAISIVVWCGASIPLLVIDSCRPANVSRAKKARRGLVFITLIIGVFWTYGMYRIHEVDKNSMESKLFRIAVVQEDPSYREAIEKMRARSDMLGGDIQLFVWPESTLSIHSMDLKSFADPDVMLDHSIPPHVDTMPMLGLSAPLIVGGRSFYGTPSEQVTKFQTAFVVASDGTILHHYHKRSLMPLGEYVPGEKLFPALHDWFQLSDHLEAGTDDAPVKLPTDNSSIGILVCYEDTMPAIPKKTTIAGAEVLVCIINASAFEDPIALRQHLRLAQLRAVENRRYLVRTAGTGISCSIDATGRIEQQIAADTTGGFVAETRLRQGWTWYQVLGNWPPLAAGLIIFVSMTTSRYGKTMLRRDES